MVVSIYKLLAKVLSIRLMKVLYAIVSEARNVFVGQIQGAVLVANDCVDTIMRSGVSGLVCKLDIEKVHDHVDWHFLLDLFGRMGFGQTFMDGEMHYYSQVFGVGEWIIGRLLSKFSRVTTKGSTLAFSFSFGDVG